MIHGVHHIGLKVDDFDKAAAFYQDVLGFKQIRTWGAGDGRAAMFDTGCGILELFAGGGAAVEGSYVHLAFKSDDVDGDYRKALAGGAKSKSEPASIDVEITSGSPMHVRIAFVFAPTGEVVEFYSEA